MLSVMETSALVCLLTTAGSIVTAVLSILSWCGVSDLFIIFMLSVLLVWFFLENRLLLSAVDKHNSTTASTKVVDNYRVQALVNIALRARELEATNTTLTQKVIDLECGTIANLHWKLVYQKAMALHYIKEMGRRRVPDTVEMKRRRSMMKWSSF